MDESWYDTYLTNLTEQVRAQQGVLSPVSYTHLRYYEAKMVQSFDFSQYLQEHNISKVLLIGNIDYFVMDEFSIRG